jgi:hypothetical protein
MSTPTIYKEPGQIKSVVLSCAVRLGTGVTISAITDTSVSDAALTVSGEVVVNSGTAISLTIAAGTDGVAYTISFAVTLSDSTTDTVQLVVNVVAAPSRTGLPIKPASFTLVAGHRYIKGVVATLAPDGDETLGVTQLDLTSAEDYAWDILLARLSTWYDVSTFGSNTPIPLQQIWDLLASAYIHAVVAQRKNVEDTQATATQDKWLAAADRMMQNLTDPVREGERMQLINPATGNIVHKRSRGSIPMVVNVRGVQFFPTHNNNNTTWGHALRGSVEEFIDTHSLIVRR